MARATFALIAGILLFTWLEYNFSSIILLFAAITIFIILIFISKRKHLLFWKGVFITIFFIVTGYFNAQHYVLKNKTNHIYQFIENIRYYEAIVIDEIEVKAKSLKTILKVVRAKDSLSWYEVEGNVVAYLPLSDSLSVAYGDKLLVRGSPELVSFSRNPEEFDFSRYLAYQNIYHQDFIQKDDYRKIGEGYGNIIIDWSYRVRKYCKDIFTNYIHEQRERAVLSALVLGIKDELDRETLKIFSSTGAMHILAVSGLHVGIIFKVLEILFSSIKNHRKWKYVFYISVFLFLWMYAFITGLSPSVMRAVVMFSFVLFGKVIARKGNIYNTLAASAFVLLCVNPFLLFNVGFQLSYFAVLGIVYLQPKMERLWEAPHLYLHYIWQIITVSLAAQIATSPLGILYFHQFPNYFLLTNLIAVPLAGIILQLGLALIFMDTIWQISLTNYLAIFLAYFLEKIIWLMNEMLDFVQLLPFSVSDGLYLTAWQTVFFYIALVVMCIGWQWRRIYWIYCSKGILILLLISKIIEVHIHSSQKMFVVFHNATYSLLLFARGQQATLFHSKPFHEEVEILDRLKSFFAKYHLALNKSIDVAFSQKDGYTIFVFNRKKIIWITQPSKLPSLEVDFIVISNNALKNLEEIAHLKYKKIILDGTNSFSFVRKWMKYGIEVHATTLKGAFVGS